MRRSLIISALLHVVVFLGGFYSFAYHHRTELSQQQNVPVEILTPAEFTILKAGVKDGQASSSETKTDRRPDKPRPKDQLKAEAPKTPPARPLPSKPLPSKTAASKPAPAAIEPPAAPPKAAPPKPREPSPRRPASSDQIASLINRQDDQRHKPERKESDRREPEHRPPERKEAERPQPQRAEQSRFDAQRIAALLNRIPDGGQPPSEEPRPRTPWRPASSLDAQAQEEPAGQQRPAPRPQGADAGSGAQMTVNEVDAFRAQISRCWSPPPGGLGNQTLVVRLHIELKQDGSLLRPPQVMNGGANGGGSPFFQAAADSAVRAVFECQPYLMPAQKYDQWRDMVLNFDPRQMYGG